MNTMTNMEKILKQMESKERRLKKVMESGSPINPAHISAHHRRQENAAIFLDELYEISHVTKLGVNLKLVSLTTLEKQVEKADFTTIDFDGQFCKLVIINNYPYDELWLLYVAPVESI